MRHPALGRGLSALQFLTPALALALYPGACSRCPMAGIRHTRPDEGQSQGPGRDQEEGRQARSRRHERRHTVTSVTVHSSP